MKLRSPGTAVKTIAIGLLTIVSVSTLIISPIDAATKKKSTTAKKKTTKVAAGQPCSPLGSSSGGLDCVKVGSAAKWAARGSRANPFRFGDSGAFATYSTPVKYQLKLTGPMTPVDLASIGVPAASQKQPPVGAVGRALPAELTIFGTAQSDIPANLADLELVASDGKSYPLYAGVECSQYTSNALTEVVGGLRIREVQPGLNSGSFCFILPETLINDQLLLRLKVFEHEELWWRTTALP